MFNIFSKEGLITFLITLPALLISLSIHEFAHAYTAYKLGDRSQKSMGRLTLNPFQHMDWLGFISIALIGFGWGKPVMVDDSNFKKKSRDNMLVALAGPLSNIILAIVFTLILKILLMFNILNISVLATNGIVSLLTTMFILAIQFNVVFAIFNMLPIPPFDGSKVLFYFLPNKFKGLMFTIEKYSFIIILVLAFTHIGSAIISPIVQGIMWLLNLVISI